MSKPTVPTSVTSKGQVTIPAEVRQRMGIRAGSRIGFRVKGDVVELRVVSSTTEMNPSESGFGMMKSKRKPVPVDFDVASLLRK
jgi:AbrB family looped-hinge helix DNA binding protein